MKIQQLLIQIKQKLEEVKQKYALLKKEQEDAGETDEDGEAGQREKLSYTSLMNQVESGQRKKTF